MDLPLTEVVHPQAFRNWDIWTHLRHPLLPSLFWHSAFYSECLFIVRESMILAPCEVHLWVLPAPNGTQRCHLVHFCYLNMCHWSPGFKDCSFNWRTRSGISFVSPGFATTVVRNADTESEKALPSLRLWVRSYSPTLLLWCFDIPFACLYRGPFVLGETPGVLIF